MLTAQCYCYACNQLHYYCYYCNDHDYTKPFVSCETGAYKEMRVGGDLVVMRVCPVPCVLVHVILCACTVQLQYKELHITNKPTMIDNSYYAIATHNLYTCIDLPNVSVVTDGCTVMVVILGVGDTGALINSVTVAVHAVGWLSVDIVVVSSLVIDGVMVGLVVGGWSGVGDDDSEGDEVKGDGKEDGEGDGGRDGEFI